MPEVSPTSLSISHISEVTLSSPRGDKSILAQMARCTVLLGKFLKSCAKEADFKQTPNLCSCHISCTQFQRMMNLQSRWTGECHSNWLHVRISCWAPLDRTPTPQPVLTTLKQHPPCRDLTRSCFFFGGQNTRVLCFLRVPTKMFQKGQGARGKNRSPQKAY